MCGHCHTVQGWDARGCWCECSSCAYVAVKCWVRLSRELDTPSRFERVAGEGSVMSEEYHQCSKLALAIATALPLSDMPAVWQKWPNIGRRHVPILKLDDC